MFKANVRVENIEGFDMQFEELLKAIDHNLEAVSSVVEHSAINSVRFVDKTGHLRRNIKKRKSKFKDGGYIVMATSPHAHLVEFGHVEVLFGVRTGRRVPPHPFLRKAVEEGYREAVKLFRS